MATRALRDISGRYVVDKEGKRIGVLLDPEAYKQILAALEESVAIRAYDPAKKRAKERFRLNRQLL